MEPEPDMSEMPPLEEDKSDLGVQEEEDEEVEEDSDPGYDNLMKEMVDIAHGEDYVGSLETVEIIFDTIEGVTSMSHVHNLVELTLIETQTSSLLGIEYCKHSLEVI